MSGVRIAVIVGFSIGGFLLVVGIILGMLATRGNPRHFKARQSLAFLALLSAAAITGGTYIGTALYSVLTADS